MIAWYGNRKTKQNFIVSRSPTVARSLTVVLGGDMLIVALLKHESRLCSSSKTFQSYDILFSEADVERVENTRNPAEDGQDDTDHLQVQWYMADEWYGHNDTDQFKSS